VILGAGVTRREGWLYMPAMEGEVWKAMEGSERTGTERGARRGSGVGAGVMLGKDLEYMRASAVGNPGDN
jgi:hypothetical protein